MPNNEFSLYTKYELRGKETAFKAYIPFKVKNDKVKCLSLSAGASISKRDLEEFNKLIKNNLRDNSKTLIEVKEVDKDEIDNIVEKIKENGGKVSRSKKEQIYNNIK